MSDQNETLARDFDAAPYPGHPYPDTHPDNLRTRAMLAGVVAPEVTNCRVLEIGCGPGANILPMAMTLPRSEFLGIDLSSVHIEDARKMAQRVGLRNVELRCQDMLDFPEDAGEFDYVIAHGVYSWIPANVRDMLMRICQRHLSPSGIAYISYNTFPGWRSKQVVREMMLFHSRSQSDPKERAKKAREMLDFASQKCPSPEHYKATLALSKQEVEHRKDGYLLHEHLEIENEPVYFEQFARHAADFGMRYLGAASSEMEIPLEILPAAQRQQIEGFSADAIVREQYLDFLLGKTFRESLLCRAERQRTIGPPAEAVAGMYVAGYLTETSGQSVGVKAIFNSHRTAHKMPLNDGGSIATFRRLRGAWPHAVAFEELAQLAKPTESAALARDILHAFYAGIVELWTRPTSFLAPDLEKPRATALARIQAAEGEIQTPVTNLRHREIPNHSVMKYLMPLMDGTRTREELRREMERLIGVGRIKVDGQFGMKSARPTLLGAEKGDHAAFFEEAVKQLNLVCLLAGGGGGRDGET